MSKAERGKKRKRKTEDREEGEKRGRRDCRENKRERRGGNLTRLIRCTFECSCKFSPVTLNLHFLYSC